MPKLSVITICYNDREGLEKTMPSVLAQTFRDFEYIVIDGGSTDGSADYIRSHAGRLAFWISEKDKGIYNAQNKGWQHAQGEYCLFLNSGDYLADERVLQTIFETKPDADIIYGELKVDNGKDPYYTLGQPDPFTFEDMIYSTLFHPAAFIRRKLLEERNGYDESFRIVADYDFFLDMLFVKKCSSHYIPIPVAVFNTAGVGSDPANKEKHDAERRRSQLKYFPLEKIVAAEKAVRSRKPRSERIKDATGRIPVVRELANFGLLVYNRLRKTRN
jgi:glycosyltransferase involved in cell wall biosynthesis